MQAECALVAEDGHRYVVICNIAKKKNVIELITNAMAYNFIPVLIGSHNIREYVQSRFDNVRYYDTLQYFKEFVCGKCPLIGIEIMDTSVRVRPKPTGL